MVESRFERSLPIAGIVAGLCFAVFGALGGSPPGVHAGIAKQVSWWHDHDSQVTVAAIAGALFLVTMAFFAAGLRQALRSGEAEESTYSSVAYAGALLVGVAIASWSWVLMAASEAGHDNDGAVVHTFTYLNDVGFLPWTAASAVMMLGAGFGGLRTAAFPKWLAIVSIVLGVGNLLGPAGIAVFFAMPLWLIATGVVLLRRRSPSYPLPSQAVSVAV